MCYSLRIKRWIREFSLSIRARLFQIHSKVNTKRRVIVDNKRLIDLFVRQMRLSKKIARIRIGISKGISSCRLRGSLTNFHTKRIATIIAGLFDRRFRPQLFRSFSGNKRTSVNGSRISTALFGISNDVGAAVN